MDVCFLASTCSYLIPIAHLAINQKAVFARNSAHGNALRAPKKTAKPRESPGEEAILCVETLKLSPFVSRAMQFAPPGFM